MKGEPCIKGAYLATYEMRHMHNYIIIIIVVIGRQNEQTVENVPIKVLIM